MAPDEIRRGDFVYRDTLFADPGGDRRHPRASVSELKELLLPTRSSTQLQDQVGHWYEAQLIHYGLPRTKDKNTAKVRLISAIAAGRLTIPLHITHMESDMKKEFSRAKVVARKATEAGSSGKFGGKGNKREAEATTSNTKVSVRVGNVSIAIDHHDGAGNGCSKRQKIDISPSSETSTPRKKQTARKSTGLPNFGRSAGKQPARRNTNAKSALRSSPLFSSPPANSQASARVNSFRYHSEVETDDAPPPYSAIDPSHTYNAHDNRSNTPRMQASGTYTLNTNFDGNNCELTIVKDKQSGQFWAHFYAAGHKGVFHIADPTGITRQETLSFRWRAQETSSGNLRFRRDQNGWIVFDGEGGIRGCWYDLVQGEEVNFEGSLSGMPNVDVDDLIDQWQWFVDCAYGR